jgi:hypothetical protein
MCFVSLQTVQKYLGVFESPFEPKWNQSGPAIPASLSKMHQERGW